MRDLQIGEISEDCRALNPELNETLGKAKRLKYGNKPAFAVDRTFQSGREAVRAGELSLLQKIYEIFCLCFQVEFPLPGGVKYIADFVYLDKDLMPVVEDAKGVRTKDYRIKKKLFKEKYGLEIREI